MLKKILRKIRSNPLDIMLKRVMKQGKSNILIEWNRGLGDIPLGLFSVVKRVKQFIPDAKITFVTREDLKEGFSMLGNVNVAVCPFWERNKEHDLVDSLQKIGLKPDDYDLIIEKPDPTYWVKWQLGKITPMLSWNSDNDKLYKKFSIDQSKKIIAIQPDVGSSYNLWRTLSISKWQQLLSEVEKLENIQVLLIGSKESKLEFKNALDLRGKTTIFELLSILKNACDRALLLDGGILSLIYYLDVTFSLKIVSLWGDSRQGVIKQGVKSPNKGLIHEPIIGGFKNVNSILVDQIYQKITS